MIMAGHRHMNVVTPFPSEDSETPENGFWQVETPSLRDFPQQFRTYEILRNMDNSLSILTTCIDPVHKPGSPSAKSLGYAIGTRRLFGLAPLDDTSSLVYNAELLVPLTQHMQNVISSLGAPLGHQVAIDSKENSIEINFLGTLLTSDNISEDWSNLTNISPYLISESRTNTTTFYRSVE